MKDGQEEMESGDVLLFHDLKGKERRYRRTLQLRKNRHDADLEKKARTGHCKQSIQYRFSMQVHTNALVRKFIKINL